MTHLGATLLVGILVLDAVHFEAVRLQRAALRERLLTEIAFVGADAGVGSRVSLQVEGVVEALAAERAEISLHVRVAFHVSVQQALESEVLRADPADELAVLLLSRGRGR